MLRCLRPLFRFFGLATASDLAPRVSKATELCAQVDVLSARLDAMLDRAYGEAPVIRIHHGTPPHLH